MAHVHAEVLVQLELNLAQIIALRTTEAWVATHIDQDISIELPGGLLGQTAALAALTAGEPVWVLGNEGREWRRSQSDFGAEADGAVLHSLVSLDSSFEIRAPSGETRVLHSRFVGLLLPSGKVLTTAEAVEPWSFDAALAEAIGRHEISVKAETLEIVAWMDDPHAGSSLQRNEIHILKPREREKHMISAENRTAYRQRLRESDENAVLLDVRGMNGGDTATNTIEIPESGQWQPAAIFRFDPEASSGKPTLWLTQIKRENGRYLLEDPVGCTAVGSPVWVEGGVVGIVQDEGSAAMLPNILKSFSSELH